MRIARALRSGLPEATASPLLSLASSLTVRRDSTQGSRGGPWDPPGGRARARLASPSCSCLFFSESRGNPAGSRTRLERSRASTRWLGRPTGLNRGSQRSANLLSMNDVGPESLTTPAVEGRSLALPYRSVLGWGALAEDGREQPSTSGRAWLTAGVRG